MNNQQLRQTIRQQRCRLSTQFQQGSTQRIANLIKNQDFFTTATHIAYFMPFNGEASPLGLLDEARRLHKNIYLPTLNLHHKTLLFLPYLENTPLVKNQYGIAEVPFQEEHIFFPWKLDLVFVPLVVFDSQCHRLGMGAGYYDRTFAFIKQVKKKPLLCGIAYEFQRNDMIKPAAWDIPMDYIVTEEKIWQGGH